MRPFEKVGVEARWCARKHGPETNIVCLLFCEKARASANELSLDCGALAVGRGVRF